MWRTVVDGPLPRRGSSPGVWGRFVSLVEPVPDRFARQSSPHLNYRYRWRAGGGSRRGQGAATRPPSPRSRPRGAVGSGAAAGAGLSRPLIPCADSVVSRSLGCVAALVGWDACEVRGSSVCRSVCPCVSRLTLPVPEGLEHGCEVRRRGPCAFVRPRVPCVCVRSHTDTHSHSHTHIHTIAGTAKVPRGGGLEGRHAHGELEAHGGSGEEYGSCVRENDGCRDSRAMVCKEGAGGGTREAYPCVSRHPRVLFTGIRCLFTGSSGT
jgi:hypothetical protein